MEEVRILLVSTYELGRQPFGLASPAAWLRAEGHSVTVSDLSCSPLPAGAAAAAELIAFFLPMHTATRLFLRLVDRMRELNPKAHLCGYGLYAPLNEKVLRSAGVRTVIGGEFEPGLVELARRLGEGEEFIKSTQVSLARQQFLVPDRSGMPALGAYAQLVTGEGTRCVGYTEASRGCKHLCRHCPVVPVYQGTFRIVQQEVVLEDIRRQVAARPAYHVRRSGFSERAGARHADCGRAASGMAPADVRRHDQGGASLETSGTAAAIESDGVPVCDQRGRVAGRSRAREAR